MQEEIYNLGIKYAIYLILIIVVYIIFIKLIYIKNNFYFYRQYNILNNKFKKISSIKKFNFKWFWFIYNFDLKNNYKKMLEKIGFQYYIYLIFIKLSIKFILSIIILRFLIILIILTFDIKTKFNLTNFINFFLKQKFGDYKEIMELLYLLMINICIIFFIKFLIQKIIEIFNYKIKIINDNKNEIFFWNNLLIEKNNSKLKNEFLKQIIITLTNCNNNDFELIPIENKVKFFYLKNKIKKIKEYNKYKKKINIFTKLFLNKIYDKKKLIKYQEKLKNISIEESKLILIIFKKNKDLINFYKNSFNYKKKKINSNQLLCDYNKVVLKKSSIKLLKNKNYYSFNFDIKNLIFKNLNMKLIFKKIIRLILIIILVLLILFLSTPTAIYKSILIILNFLNINIIPNNIKIFGYNYFFPTFLIICINTGLIVLIDYFCKYQNHFKFSNYQLNVFQIAFIYLFINIVFLPLISINKGDTLFSLFFQNNFTFINFFKKINIDNDKNYLYEFLFQITLFGFIINFSLFSELFLNKFSYYLMKIRRNNKYFNYWRKTEFNIFQIGYYYSVFCIIFYILLLFGLFDTKVYLISFLTLFSRLISDSSMILCYYGKEFECNFKIIKAVLKRIEIGIIFLNLLIIIRFYFNKNITNNIFKLLIIIINIWLIFFYFRLVDSKLKKSNFKINIKETLKNNDIINFKKKKMFQKIN